MPDSAKLSAPSYLDQRRWPWTGLSRYTAAHLKLTILSLLSGTIQQSAVTNSNPVRHPIDVDPESSPPFSPIDEVLQTPSSSSSTVKTPEPEPEPVILLTKAGKPRKRQPKPPPKPQLQPKSRRQPQRESEPVKDLSAHWYTAQLIHYGLIPTNTKAVAKSRLLAALEQRAVELGHHTVRLDTNRSLDEAKAMYRARGYVEIDRYNANPYANHWFEKRLRVPPAPEYA